MPKAGAEKAAGGGGMFCDMLGVMMRSSLALLPKGGLQGKQLASYPVYLSARTAQAEAELHASQPLSPQAVSVDPELGW